MVPEVSWIRLSTRIFENRKIKHLLSQPKGAELTVLWIRLLCLAGIINDGGKVYVTSKVPYAPQTLAADTGVPVTTVKKAWELFQALEMIKVTQEGYIEIISWEEHQNIDGLNKMRSQTRERVKRLRGRNSNADVTQDVTLQSEDGNADVTQDVTLQSEDGNADVTQMKRQCNAPKNKNKNKNKEKDDYHHPKRKCDDDDDKKTRYDIFPLWEKNISPLTAMIGEKLAGLIAEVGEAAVEQGIIAAVEHGARNFSYVQTVARNFASGGRNSQKAQSDKANLSYSEMVQALYGEKSTETPQGD